MAENLNKSFAVIFGLVVLIIIQHLAHLLTLENVWLSVSIDILVLTCTFIYFLQLKNNLHAFLGIHNISVPLYILLSSYFVTYLFSICFKIVRQTNLINSSFYSTILIVCFGIVMLGTVILIVQYGIIGFRLFKRSELKNLKNLGAAFLFVIPVFFVIVFVLSLTRETFIYSHLFIVLELIPYWFTYKLYSGFRKNSAQENLPGDPITFYTNAGS